MHDNEFSQVDDGQGQMGKNDKVSEALIVSFV